MVGKYICRYGEGGWWKYMSRVVVRNVVGIIEYLFIKYINGLFWGKWKIRSLNVFCFYR